MHSRTIMYRTKPRRASQRGPLPHEHGVRTEKDPGHEGVGIELGRVPNIANGQQVELGQAPAARGVEGKENGPQDDAAAEADVPDDLEEAQEEEAVE